MSNIKMSLCQTPLYQVFKCHTGEFPRGVGHRVENGWGLTKVAVVLLTLILRAS